MILAVDVGNSNIVLGALEKGCLLFSARCATDRLKTEDEYALIFQDMLALHGVPAHAVEGGILSSVVPVLRHTVPRAVEHVTGKRMLVLTPGMETGMRLRVEAPERLGTDRIADAVAARALYPAPLVVFDMGTATTLSVIDREGDYIGGMIIPGLRVAVDSLSARTAQLPHINFDPPRALIGVNTEECMKSGAIYGCAAMLDGLIERVERELGQPATAVLTGGLSPFVAPFCRRQLRLRPDLLLLGLEILYEMNCHTLPAPAGT